MKVKLLLILVPVLIAILFISVYSSFKIGFISDVLTEKIYTDSYKPVSLILNADRDFYQALVAQNNLLNEGINKTLVADFKENAGQVKDRVNQAKDIIIKNNDLYLKEKHITAKKNIAKLMAEFDVNFKKWSDLYNINENKVTDKEQLAKSFDYTREILNQLGEILDAYAAKVNTQSKTLTENTIILVMAISLTILIIGLGTGLVIILNINKQTYKILNIIRKTSDLDFIEDYGEINIGSDEFGMINEAEINTRKQIKDTINIVNDEFHNFKDLIDVTNSRMSNINNYSQAVMSTTQEITAGTEETAASSQQINATIVEVRKMIKDISDEAESSSKLSNNICENVENIKKDALRSQNLISDIYSNTKEKLKMAIDESKAVEDINALSEAILQITSQTNLLALNALIESSRAGEAGKGFKVVADEIRILAENSNKVVNEIKETVNNVIVSVDHLSSSSEEMLELIEDKVIKGYKSQINTIEQYNKDSLYFNEMSSELSKTTSKLLDTIDIIVNVVNEICIANNQNAEGVSDVAKKINNMHEMTDYLKDRNLEVKERFDDIFELLMRFKLKSNV